MPSRNSAERRSNTPIPSIYLLNEIRHYVHSPPNVDEVWYLLHANAKWIRDMNTKQSKDLSRRILHALAVDESTEHTTFYPHFTNYRTYKPFPQSTAETDTQTQNTVSIDHPRSQLPGVGSPSDAQVLSSGHVDLILPMQFIGRAEPGPRTQDAVSMDHSRSRSLGVGSPSHTGLQSSAQTTAPICSLLLDFSSLIMTATSTATESKTSDEQVRYTIMFVRKVKNTIITHPIPYLLPFASTNSLGLMQ
jgi:hypothetical protein